MAVRQQQRRGTAAQWTAANPILSAAEIGFEIDTNKFKIGDGINRWADLVYFTADAASALNDLIDGAPDLLNTLNELAAAVGDDPTFFTTVATNLSNHESDSTNVHGIADTSVLVTQTDLTNAISGATVDQSGLAGVGIDWNSLTESFDIDSTVATKTYADGKASDAQTAAANALASHESDTTNVHGIADTSALATKTYADGAVETAVAALTRSSVGLGNVNNTSDADKPISTATQAELDLKAPKTSPVFLGNPEAPTQANGDDSTRIATTAFVKTSIQNIASLDLVLDGGGV